MKKPSSLLYGLTRFFGKAASTAKDIETLATLNPVKIAKRAARKAVNRKAGSLARKINKLLK